MARQRGSKNQIPDYRNGGQKIPSMKQYIRRFWKNVIIKGDNECWEWKGRIDRDGYGKFHCCHLNPACLPAHRFSMMIYKRRLLKYEEKVLHSCDNRPCVNPNHLYIGTNQNNVQDALDRNRYPKGEEVPSSKLNPDKVRKIRRLFLKGYNGVELAEKFQVSNVLIYLIVKRKAWRHVP